MIRRRALLIAAPLVTVAARAAERVPLTHIRFGILREVSDGLFDFVKETTRLPMKLKHTGFRWGLAFDNPQCRPITWHEEVHLPADLKEVSGHLQRARTRTMRTQTFRSSRPSVIDDFWFDEGDPLGAHQIQLFVDGALRFTLDFQVVEDR